DGWTRAVEGAARLAAVQAEFDASLGAADRAALERILAAIGGSKRRKGEMKVEIYSDVACPWCYIAERRFARALAAYPGGDRVEVVYRSYQLGPEAPAEAVPMMEYLSRRFGDRVDGMLERVSENARVEGIEMAWDRALSVNTLTAHRLLRLAEREYGPAVQRA